jgi:ribosome recycling factor
MINTPEARLITVQIYDAGALDAVEKAIRSADLGFNPAREGSLLRIVVPALTEERRKEIVKSLSRMAEDAKVVLRNLRRDELDVLKKKEKNKEISADDLKRAQEAVQKVVDAFVVDIDKLLQAKEKEVMAV